MSKFASTKEEAAQKQEAVNADREIFLDMAGPKARIDYKKAEEAMNILSEAKVPAMLFFAADGSPFQSNNFTAVFDIEEQKEMFGKINSRIMGMMAGHLCGAAHHGGAPATSKGLLDFLAHCMAHAKAVRDQIMGNLSNAPKQ